MQFEPCTKFSPIAYATRGNFTDVIAAVQNEIYIDKIGKRIADTVYENSFFRKRRSLFSECYGGCCREFVGYIDITPAMLRSYHPNLRNSIKIKGPPSRAVFRCVRSGQQMCGNDFATENSFKRSQIMTQEFGIENYGCCKPTGFDTVNVIVGKRNRHLTVDIPLSPSGCECGFD